MRTEFLYFTPSIYSEYYVYFKKSKLNRFRISVGIQTKVTAHLEFEIYFLQQFENSDFVKSLSAMGLVVKFYFSHRDTKKRFFPHQGGSKRKFPLKS